MPVTATAAVALAVALDRLVGEPRDALHPVAWFGRLVAPFDAEWPRPRLVGAFVALAQPLIAGATVGLLVWGGTLLHPAVGAALAGLALFATTSHRALVETAEEVLALTASDRGAARERLPALVGRDPTDLSGAQLRSAAVESAAENLADGLVAPLFAFAALAPLSLPLAAAAAAWVKAVDTLDSMLGYRSKPVGTASARLDDAVAWLPARLSAVCIAVVAADPDALSSARSWADATPSPNSGWPMGTLAGALRVRLEKPGEYELNPMGTLPTVAEATHGVRIVERAGVLAFVAAGVVAWF